MDARCTSLPVRAQSHGHPEPWKELNSGGFLIDLDGHLAGFQASQNSFEEVPVAQQHLVQRDRDAAGTAGVAGRLQQGQRAAVVLPEP